MSQVEIQVYLLAQTKLSDKVIERWLSDMGVDAEKFWDGVPSELGDPELLVALAGKRCYKSFEAGLNPNVTKIRKDYAVYFDNILASGHGSVLEHASYSFAFENVSRVFTAEMNRHRAGVAISEGSQRFIRFQEDIPYWLPNSLRVRGDESNELADRKIASATIFADVFKYVQERYADLLSIWDMDEGNHDFAYKKQVTSCLRRIVPIGCATGGVWTMNIRALRHIITMRCSPQAEEEILHVFGTVMTIMSQLNPSLFGDFEKTPEGFWVPSYRKV